MAVNNEQMIVSDVFKVQRPLAGNAVEEALFYNEDKSILDYIPLEWLPENFFRGKDKVYILASINEEEQLLIHEYVDQPDW